MNPVDFDLAVKSWTLKRSRRDLLLSLGGGMLASAACVMFRNQAVTGRSGIDTVATPAAYSELDPILPNLTPIPIGDNSYIVNGQVAYIDPLVAESVRASESPIVQISLDEESVYVNLDAVPLPEASPEVSPLATPDVSNLEAVCGVNNSQDVETYHGDLDVTIEFVAGNQRAVGNLQWYPDVVLRERYTDPGNVGSVRWCSGTLIDQDLFLTAGHCFNQDPPDATVPRINGTVEPIPRSEIATNMRVNFGWQLDPNGNLQLGETFPVVELVEDGLGAQGGAGVRLDYAIVRLAGSPGLTHGISRVVARDVAINDIICLIGHPQGMPKRLATGPVSDIQNHRVLYNCIDTARGSSGSGLLSTPDGPIIGIHTTGGCRGNRENEAGSECSPVQSAANSGVLVSSLLPVSEKLREIAQKF